MTSILLSWLCFCKIPTQVHVQYSCIILMRFKLLCKGNTRFQTQCPRKPKNCINFQCSLVRVYVSGRICGEYRTCLESCYVIVIDNPQLARSKFQFLHIGILNFKISLEKKIEECLLFDIATCKYGWTRICNQQMVLSLA